MDRNHRYRKALLTTLVLLGISFPAQADTVICFIVFGPCTNETKEKTKDTDKAHEVKAVGSEMGARAVIEGADATIEGADVTGAQSNVRKEPDK